MKKNPFHKSNSSDILFDEVKFERVACNHCGSNKERLLFEGPDRLHGLPGSFRLVECMECGWIRQNPRPTRQTIDVYYPVNYEPFKKAIDDEPFLHRWDRRYGMIKRCRAIEKHQDGGGLLDVGCATGNFLNEMWRRGIWKVYGIEPDAAAANYAVQRFGFEIHRGTLATSPFSPNRFDVITMWNVLEHLHTPWDDLLRVRDLLRPGGLFVFSIPNLEGVGARLFGPLWLGWDLPRHLYLFPRESLIQNLSEIGLDVFSVKCLSGSQDASVVSLQMYLESKFGRESPWPQRAARFCRTLPVRLLVAPFFRLMNILNQSAIVTLFARKV
jgi:2-polyprenyl-3-methyl-5-hydroxy-6-metoxy-1,4-benzoquinol methylase